MTPSSPGVSDLVRIPACFGRNAAAAGDFIPIVRPGERLHFGRDARARHNWLTAHGGLDDSTTHVQVALLDNLAIVTDVPDYPKEDRVFPVLDDEALFLSDLAFDLLSELKPKTVLDLGTGSGVIALRLAPYVHRIAAVDINPRCIHFARANVRANNVRNVELAHGDLYSPLQGQRFDLVVSNPPFLPVPPGARFHLAGNGGPDGTRVIRRILAGVAQFLSPGGCLLFLAISLSRRGRPLILDLVSRVLGPNTIVSSMRVYADPLPLDEFHPLFCDWPGYPGWLRWIQAAGFDALEFLAIRLSTCKLPPLVPRPLTKTGLSGGWPQRLRRYRLWLDPHGQA